MCNDAIRIAIKEKPKSRFRLIKQAYQRLKEYGLHTHYILSACEVAFTTYSNKDRKANPYVKRAFLKITSQSYRLDHLILRIPTKRPRDYIYLTLQASDYHLSLIDDPTLRMVEPESPIDHQPGILEGGHRGRAMWKYGHRRQREEHHHVGYPRRNEGPRYISRGRDQGEIQGGQGEDRPEDQAGPQDQPGSSMPSMASERGTAR